MVSTRRLFEIRRRLIPFLALVLGASACLRAQATHPVTLEDLQNLREVSSLDLAADGQHLVYTTYEGDLWLVSTRKGSTPRNLGKGILPRWSPNSQLLAYYSTSSGTLQLWVRNIETEQAEQVTRIEDGINPDPRTMTIGTRAWMFDSLRYGWSPDSIKLVFASQVVVSSTASDARSGVGPIRQGVEGTPLVLTSTTPPEWTLTGVFRSGGFNAAEWVNGNLDFATVHSGSAPPPRKTNQLFVVNIRDKKIQQLTKDEDVYFTPDWSPDGRKIVCASLQGRLLAGAGSGPTNIVSIDIETRRKIALTADGDYKRIPRWSPDGKWVGYLAAEKYGYQKVATVPGSGGDIRKTGTKLNREVSEFDWGPDSSSFISIYRDGVANFIAPVRQDSETYDKPFDVVEAWRVFLRVSPLGAIAWVESDGSKCNTIQFLSRGAPTSFTVVDLNPQIRTWLLGPQEVVRWRNTRGDQLEGVLIKPVGYKEGRRYPLIVNGYPGIPNTFLATPMAADQAWASRGYAIFYPDARTPHKWTTPFKSEEFDHAGKGPNGLSVMVDDVISGVDELVRRDLIDPNRIGLYGFSNGGGVVNQLVTLSNRFKCAVSVAAALSTDWSRTYFLHTLSPTVPYLASATPWEDPGAYVQLSAVYRLDRVSSPMLLADGDDDGDFLLNQIEMYNGLRALGKDVTLLRYPGQGHGFDGAAMKDFWERENTFFDKYLKTEAPPN